MKYFRKSRYARRSTRIRRKYSRFNRRSRRPGTKRFFRMQRRFAKPEIKWLEWSAVDQTIQPAFSNTRALLPEAVPVGSGSINERIGRQIKLRKLLVNFGIRAIRIQTTVENQQQHVEANVRCVVWTPIRPLDEAQAYINARLALDHFDWNIVRIHRDFWVNVANSQTFFPIAGSADNLISAGQHSTICKKLVIPHPRNLDFGTSDTIDVDKGQIYMTLYVKAPGCAVSWNFITKCTYIDP